jgi:hypothetical protein
LERLLFQRTQQPSPDITGGAGQQDQAIGILQMLFVVHRGIRSLLSRHLLQGAFKRRRTGLQFSSEHLNRLWGFNADLDSVTLDRFNDDYDVAGNLNLFSDLSGKNQHQSILLGRTPGTLESRPNTLVLKRHL